MSGRVEGVAAVTVRVAAGTTRTIEVVNKGPMEDFLSSATARARRNVLAAGALLVLFEGFVQGTERLKIAGFEVLATSTGVSAILSVGVAYFLVAFLLNWWADLSRFKASRIETIGSAINSRKDNFFQMHHAVTKWERDYRDSGVEHEKLADLLGSLGPLVNDGRGILRKMARDYRLYNRLTWVRYYIWDMGLSVLIAVTGLTAAAGLLPLDTLFQTLGWAEPTVGVGPATEPATLVVPE